MRAAALAGATLAGMACGPPAAEPSVRIEGAVMGTTWHLTVVASPVADSELRRAVEDSFAAVDRAMSTWKPDSEISRFNAALPGTELPVSTLTAEVLLTAQRVAEQSGGAFDPTILPLVELWGFGPGGAPERAPRAEEIAAARALVDHRALVLRPGPVLRKTRAGMQLDLSGVAKGDAVDRAAGALERLGCGRYLIELGGEVRVLGSSPRGEPWHIGIDRPQPGAPPGGQPQAILALRSGAVATSGDYRSWRELGGSRVSHTIDPRSGRPVEHDLASVTVLAERCAVADAFATAILVLGPEKGLALAERARVDAYLVVRDGEGFRTEATSALAARLFEP